MSYPTLTIKVAARELELWSTMEINNVNQQTHFEILCHSVDTSVRIFPWIIHNLHKGSAFWREYISLRGWQLQSSARAEMSDADTDWSRKWWICFLQTVAKADGELETRSLLSTGWDKHGKLLIWFHTSQYNVDQLLVHSSQPFKTNFDSDFTEGRPPDPRPLIKERNGRVNHPASWINHRTFSCNEMWSSDHFNANNSDFSIFFFGISRPFASWLH